MRGSSENSEIAASDDVDWSEASLQSDGANETNDAELIILQREFMPQLALTTRTFQRGTNKLLDVPYEELDYSPSFIVVSTIQRSTPGGIWSESILLAYQPMLSTSCIQCSPHHLDFS